MNDEIKKILDDLLFTTTLPNVSIKLNKEKLNQLKDYITNLQQENDNLKNIISSVKEDFLNANNELTNLQQKNERLNHQLELQEELTERNRLRKHCYKSRIEKADWWLREMLKQAKSDETKAIISGALELLLSDRSDK